VTSIDVWAGSLDVARCAAQSQRVVERADAVREVILSAGTIGSPHILQLSGVGDPEHLGKIGVPVVHELRGVGKNMQDHYVARVSYPIVGAQTANERSRGLPLGGEVMRWLFTGKGMLTYSPSIVAASVKVLEESATPDVQCTFAPGSFKNGQIGELEETPGISAGAGRCDRCRAAMSRPSRTGPATRRQSTRAISPRKATARDHRRPTPGAAAIRRPGLAALRPRRNPARPPNPERRRIARLRAAQRRHLLSRQLHLPDGLAPDERRRQRIARPRPRRVIDASVMPVSPRLTPTRRRS
jgi:choline dehydrogenase